MFAPTLVHPRVTATRRPRADWGYVITADGRVRRVDRHGDLLIDADGTVLGRAPRVPDRGAGAAALPPMARGG